jgi:hypothetical protein
MLAFNETQWPDCVFGNVSSSYSIWLIGDSHANHWFPAVEAVAKKYNVKLVIHARSGCPILDVALTNPNVKTATYENCTNWTKQVMSAVEKAHPNLLIVGGTVMITGFNADSYGRQLKKLNRMADHMVVLGDTPHSDKDLPVCVSAHLDDASFCDMTTHDGSATLDWPKMNAAVQAVAVAAGGTYVDTQKWVCTADGKCPVIVGNVLLYRDQSHLTIAGSKWLAPDMEQALKGFLPAK